SSSSCSPAPGTAPAGGNTGSAGGGISSSATSSASIRGAAESPPPAALIRGWGKPVCVGSAPLCPHEIAQTTLDILPFPFPRLGNHRFQSFAGVLRQLIPIPEVPQPLLALIQEPVISEGNRRIQGVYGLERVLVRADLRRTTTSLEGQDE